MNRTAVLIASVLALAACEDPTRLTQSPPSFGAAAKQGSPSPRVIRFQDQLSFFNLDESVGLASAIGLPDDPAASDFFCAGTEPFETLDWKFVLHASGAVKAQIEGRDLNYSIYDVAFVDPTGAVTCDFITSPRLYVGTVRLQYHDNDYFFSQVHTDSFGWTAQGIVTEQATGRRFRVTDRLHVVVHPDGSAGFHTSIQLRPL